MTNEEYIKNELNALYKERGEKALKRFEVALSSGLKNGQLLSILEDVKEVWKDKYRPTLISLSCEAVGGNTDDADTVSLIIALAGAGIGIHDDIIDKSTIKGSRRTILGLHNLKGALLVGDLLIVKGLTEIQEIVKQGYEPEKVAEIIKVIQHHYFEICEGVFMESLWKKNVEIDLDFCHQVLWKYGSDGEACTRLGAIMGNGTKEEVDALGEYGRRLCYVFRLAEEIKDTFSLDLFRRLEFESIPLPLLYAAKVSKRNSLKSPLRGIKSSSDVATLLELCDEAESFEYVNRIAHEKIKEGRKLLHSIRPSKARDFLELMIMNVFPERF